MRLAPLPADQWDEATQQALSAMRGADTNNALSTFAHHPALAKAFLRFNVHLLMSSTLPTRIRELAILRIAHRRECAYEWSHHVSMATDAGITHEQIDAVKRGEAADEFDRNEKELSELVGEGRVTPHIGATFALAETSSALRLVADGQAIGKVVIDVGDQTG